MADINVSAGSWRHRNILPSLSSDDHESFVNFCNLHFAVESNEYCDETCDNNSPSSSPLSLVTTMWTLGKIMARRLASAYLSSPVMLAMLPFMIGITVGWLLCSNYRGCVTAAKRRDERKTTHDDGNNQCSISNAEVRKRNTRVSSSLQKLAATCCATVLTFVVTSTWTLLLCFGAGSAEQETEREEHARRKIRSDDETQRESGVDVSNVPRHIAVIMDGNRRYGRAKYGSSTKGHWDGSKKLVDFAKWCLAEEVQILTVYAFSTENWSRDAAEISALMKIFCKYCDELREEAIERGIRIKVLSTETERLPDNVKAGIKRMVEESAHGKKMLMNICLSYGSRGEIVNACKSITSEVVGGRLALHDIKESELGKRMLTGECPDPDVIIRTSGELRLSNFMLWQLAYSEMFFLNMQWPEMVKSDLLNVIRSYADGRQRRFGK